MSRLSLSWLSIQPRTSPLKFDHFVVKSEKGSISNFSTKVQAAFALGEFVSALKEEAKNQAMLKNASNGHNAPAIGGQLSAGLKIRSTSNSLFHTSTSGRFLAV